MCWLGLGSGLCPSHATQPDIRARLCAQAEAAGKPMAAFDSLIAATTLEHGLAVVTRNVSDFAHAPAVQINPWDTAPGAQ